jgi:hypothetical protein
MGKGSILGKINSTKSEINGKILELQNTGVDTTARNSITLLERNLTEKTSYGVVSGLTVSAQSTPNMTVQVATGIIYMANGIRYTPTANNALAVNTADITNPRIDIIYVSSVGVISYLAGTAAVTPTAPNIPSGGMLLAEISVPVNSTAITTANIADRHKNIWTEAWIIPTLTNGWVEVSASYTPKYMKDQMGFVHIKGCIKNGTNGTAAFTLPVGYRPATRGYFAIINANTNNVATGVLYTDGQVMIACSDRTWIGLDNIVFRAEQ